MSTRAQLRQISVYLQPSEEEQVKRLLPKGQTASKVGRELWLRWLAEQTQPLERAS